MVAFDRFLKYTPDEKKNLLSHVLGIDRSPTTKKNFLTFLNDILSEMGLADYPENLYDEYVNIYYHNIDKEVAKLSPNINKKNFLIH